MNEHGITRGIFTTTASTGAESVQITLRPSATGYLWRLIWAYGYHISGGNRDICWRWTDPDQAVSDMGHRMTLGDRVGLHFGQVNTNYAFRRDEIWISRNRYPTFLLVATGAGDDAYVQALIEEWKGVDANV